MSNGLWAESRTRAWRIAMQLMEVIQSMPKTVRLRIDDKTYKTFLKRAKGENRKGEKGDQQKANPDIKTETRDQGQPLSQIPLKARGFMDHPKIWYKGQYYKKRLTNDWSPRIIGERND